MPEVALHPHARLRLPERGATEDEIVETVLSGRRYPVKFGRMGFRKTFVYNGTWRGRSYGNKEVEAIAITVPPDGWLVLTVITRYF